MLYYGVKICYIDFIIQYLVSICCLLLISVMPFHVLKAGDVLFQITKTDDDFAIIAILIKNA